MTLIRYTNYLYKLSINAKYKAITGWLRKNIESQNRKKLARVRGFKHAYWLASRYYTFKYIFTGKKLYK